MPASFEPLRVGDQRPGAGILQPVGDRVDAEQHRERQRDGAELVDGDVDRRDLRRLRQQDRDAVAARNAVGGEHIGEPVRGLAQRAIGHLVDAAVGAHVEDGNAARFGLRPAVADVDADIVARRHLPAERTVERIVVARSGKHGGANIAAKARTARCAGQRRFQTLVVVGLNLIGELGLHLAP